CAKVTSGTSLYW
nr:immunoglobulin heavy chain junction region [Macaca mulatta]